MNWSVSSTGLWSALEEIHRTSGLESSFCSTASTSCLKASGCQDMITEPKFHTCCNFPLRNFNQIHLSKYSEFLWDLLLMDISSCFFVCFILVIQISNYWCLSKYFWPWRMWKKPFPIHCRGPKPVPQPPKSRRVQLEFMFLFAKLQIGTTIKAQIMGTPI